MHTTKYKKLPKWSEIDWFCFHVVEFEPVTKNLPHHAIYRGNAPTAAPPHVGDALRMAGGSTRVGHKRIYTHHTNFSIRGEIGAATMKLQGF